MSSRPNPARLADYQAKLAQLMAAREEARTGHDDHRVRALNRQIRAQLKWIRKAVALEADRPRP